MHICSQQLPGSLYGEPLTVPAQLPFRSSIDAVGPSAEAGSSSSSTSGSIAMARAMNKLLLLAAGQAQSIGR